MVEKFILILKSSPRTNANSSVLADQVADGARSAGAQVESFELGKMHIQPCDACEGCHGSTGEGICILDDDMTALYPKLREADAIVLASPIYWFTYTAQLKLCIDRWYALETTRGNALHGKTLGIILAYGDTDPCTSGAVNAIRTFEDMARYLHMPIAGMVYGTASNPGDILVQKDLLQKAHALGEKLAGG
ncbi:MAG TPA: flavodoxin family protein [Anaerolineaceae bacterium]|jgi:multimeric flavodoxin WrbA